MFALADEETVVATPEKLNIKQALAAAIFVSLSEHRHWHRRQSSRICTDSRHRQSNLFLIPSHQVNALFMGPAGYRVFDFMKAGGIVTAPFLFVMILMMSLVF